MPLKSYDNEIGKIFGNLKLTRVDETIEKGYKRRQCEVECLICQNTKKLPLHKVLEGNYKSCGCQQRVRRNKSRTNYQSYVGQTIEDYVIDSFNSEDRSFMVHCAKCNVQKNRDAYKTVHKKYGECECKRFHNMSHTDMYTRWKAMKTRCFNPNSRSYKDYGGRGITVCDRWREDFVKFYEDMGDPPTPAHQLDRINNNGNYEPDNCRWATPLQNNNNQREKTHNKTGYQNVVKRGNKYEAGFEYDKIYYHVGTFDSAKEAYEQTVIKKKEIHKRMNEDIV